MYGIKPGYVENPKPDYYLDAPQGDLIYQPDVLPLAEKIAVEAGLSRIVDIGCGWAEKLVPLHARHPEWEFVGVDYGANLDYCRETYDWGTWVEKDLEEFQVFDFDRAVVVVSDVIEHLVDPRELMRSLYASHGAFFVFSTPERDLQYGVDHMGPCPNPCHVREWNQAEFETFMGDMGLVVRHVGLTRTNTGGPEEQTILAVATL